MNAFEITDTTKNLCDVCFLRWPDCTAQIKFGDGLGGDNIVGCTEFCGEVTVDEVSEVTLTKEEFDQNYE